MLLSLSPCSIPPGHAARSARGRAQPWCPPAQLQGSGCFSLSPAPRFHCSYENSFLSSVRSGLMQSRRFKGAVRQRQSSLPRPQKSSPSIPVQTHPKKPTETIRKAAPACAMGRHHLPAAACQAWGRLLSSSSRSAASRQQEHRAQDGGTEHSSTPCLYGKPTNASHQSKQLLAQLHCLKSLAQSWPRREERTAGRLRANPCSLVAGPRALRDVSASPDPAPPGRASNLPLQEQFPMCRRLSCKPAVRTQPLQLFPSIQHVCPCRNPTAAALG